MFDKDLHHFSCIYHLLNAQPKISALDLKAKITETLFKNLCEELFQTLYLVS